MARNLHRLDKSQLVKLAEMLIETNDLIADDKTFEKINQDDLPRYKTLQKDIGDILKELENEFIGLFYMDGGGVYLDNDQYYIEAASVDDLRKVIELIENGQFQFDSDVEDGMRKINHLETDEEVNYSIAWTAM